MSLSLFKLLVAGALLLLAIGCLVAALSWLRQTGLPLHNIAFYYGHQPNWPVLEQYQMVVLEPDHNFDLQQRSGQTLWLAYVSIGEVVSSRGYYGDIPQKLILRHNPVWDSMIVDVSQEEWTSLLLEKVFRPLATQGYDGFFLDTVDAYQTVCLGEAKQQTCRQGLKQLIRRLKTELPGGRIILNRGFELFPEVGKDVYALAFESLYRGWDQAASRYVAVPAADREWLLARVTDVRRHRRLPVIAIDYCDPQDQQCRKDISRQIRSKGMVPFVTDGHLTTVNPAPPL